MPDRSAEPQPKRPRRFWLFAPYVALLVAFLAWSGFWYVARLRLEHALKDGAAGLRAQGYAAAWDGLKIDGWPFRLHAAFTAPRVADRSGWGLSAPRLEAEALPYAPDRWVMVAPDGLTLTRPGKGALNVSGKAIRASAGGLGSAEPRFSFEGLDLAFAPAVGAQPGALSGADRLELHLQPGPNDQAALLIRLDGGDLRPEVPLAKLAAGQPLALLWDARLSHLSAIKGPTWPAALQAWERGGGAMQVTQGRLGLGGLALEGSGGPLTVDGDGRLKGELPLKLDPGKAANRPLLEALGLLGPAALRFQEGRAAIGPIPLGPALKVG